MLKLPQSDRLPSPVEVGRLLEADRRRTERMQQRHADLDRSHARQVMESLQQRFSKTGDLPAEISALVESRVKQRTKELFRQANYDALTHLPNRAYFGRILEQTLERAERNASVFTVLFLDLDGFKAVNDRLGHHAGDELLQNVGARLTASVRDGDVVGRRGGDEFVVLLPDLDDRRDVAGICQRIIDEVGRPYWLDQQGSHVSASIGVARYPQDGKTPAELMSHSDAALYVSKESGKATYRFFNELGSQAETGSQALHVSLERAVDNGEITLCFEPQMDLKSGRMVGAGVTAMWNEKSLSSPYLHDWSDLLAQSKRSGAVATWLMDSALHYLQSWQSFDGEIVVSVPVLPGLWQQSGWVEWLEERMRHYGVSREQLQLEFSLTALQQEGALLKNTLSELAESGYQLTLSEAGACPLDLGWLSALNVSEVKLDRAWLQQAADSQNEALWAKSLIKAAQTLDVCMIASGVQTAVQSRTFYEWGCRVGQGPVWSDPIVSERFDAYLSARYRARS